jgi:hypothetical protein
VAPLGPDEGLVRERDGVVETLMPRLAGTRVEATSEAEITAHEADDKAEAKAAAAAYARRMCWRIDAALAALECSRSGLRALVVPGLSGTCHGECTKLSLDPFSSLAA